MFNMGLKCKCYNSEDVIKCDDFLDLIILCPLDDVDRSTIQFKTNLKDKNGNYGYINDYWVNDLGVKYKLIWNDETSSLKLYDEYFHCVWVSATPNYIINGIFI